MNVINALTGGKKGISSFALRLVGFVFTLIDCIYSAGLGRLWMTSMRWAAFPIFAYLLAEGYEKTSSRELYLRRLALFTLLAEVPYDLMFFAQPVRWQSQSAMLTLLIGYVAIWLIDIVRRKLDNLVVSMLAIIAVGWGAFQLARFCNAFFYRYGIAIIIMFYLANHVPYKKIPEALVFIYIWLAISTDSAFTIMVGGLMYEIPKQIFSIMALAFIWSYNGERGPNSYRYRLGFYFIYPALMLLLTLIRVIVK